MDVSVEIAAVMVKVVGAPTDPSAEDSISLNGADFSTLRRQTPSLGHSLRSVRAPLRASGCFSSITDVAISSTDAGPVLLDSTSSRTSSIRLV